LNIKDGILHFDLGEGIKLPDIMNKIQALKQKKNAVILAHFYQTMDIQNVADHVGDSFELAKRAQSASQDVIVLCGVRFMAESAKILNPEKTVLLPASDAGCPMADMVSPEDVRRLKKQHPDAAVMCYVNSSAAVKAECDICCTSSSAVKIARSLPQKRIIFVPDQNLARYVASQVPEKEIIPFHGYCVVHQRLTEKDVNDAKSALPDALLLVHPECVPAVVEKADFVGSTSAIMDFAKKSENRDFIIGTENSIAEHLQYTCPDKQFYPLSKKLLCPNMKATTLVDVLRALKGQGGEEINLPADTLHKAPRCIDEMIRLGG
jgi:quinolinate synthase